MSISPSVAFDSDKIFYPVFDDVCNEIENDFLHRNKFNAFDTDDVYRNENAQNNDNMIVELSSYEVGEAGEEELAAESAPRMSFSFGDTIFDMIEETGSTTTCQRPNCFGVGQRETSDSTIVSQHDDTCNSDMNYMNSDTENDFDDNGSHSSKAEYDYLNHEMEHNYKNCYNNAGDKNGEGDRLEVEHVGTNIIIGQNHEGIGYISESDVLLGRGGHCARHLGNQFFLRERDRLRRPYRDAYGNVAKRQIQTQLLQSVYDRNGRFLEKIEYHDAHDKIIKYWEVVTDERQIYKKAAQALREGHS